MRAIVISNSTKAIGGSGDVTPDAITMYENSDPCNSSTVSNIVQITGITSTIDIKVTWTVTSGSEGGSIVLNYGATSGLGSSTTMTGSNSQTISNTNYIRITMIGSGSTLRKTIDIINVSDSNAVLTSFTLGTDDC